MFQKNIISNLVVPLIFILGEKWVSNILITNFLFVGPLFLIWAFLNTVAISYNSTAAFPFCKFKLTFSNNFNTFSNLFFGFISLSIIWCDNSKKFYF
jgi:hypothetical protein